MCVCVCVRERAKALVQSTPPESIFRADLREVPPLPQWGRGRVTLLGDAGDVYVFLAPCDTRVPRAVFENMSRITVYAFV